MKFYNSIGPNPRIVKMFMAEKGITVPFVEVDLMAGENRKEPYLSKNPGGQLPALELDNGLVLAEVTAICEYLEEKNPATPLIGTTPEERAETRMWTRRVDLGVAEPLANGFRFSAGLPMFKDRMMCRPETADGLKAMAQDKVKWLDKQLAGKDFLAGKRMTLADILLFVVLDFGAVVGQPIDPENKNIVAFVERMKARPSAAASA
ncbi:MAG: glutathione S-transferase family protein [Parvibaculaceae bacterium]